jgi:hypothetical protein
MTNKIVNCVGLEAEFFLRGSKDRLIYPTSDGFSTDEFPILGEFRADKGETREETLSNFMKEWYRILFLAKSKSHKIDIETGYTEIDPTFYTEILRKMGTKNIAQSKNIHPEIDLLKLTDAVVENGEIKKHYLSIGLHIHFSSSVTDKQIYKTKDAHYSQVKIPLTVGGNSLAEMNFYQKDSENILEVTNSATVSRLTKPVLYHFVKELDEKILPQYKIDVPLKYRNPGFYEIKSWGFEYRSLPFNKSLLSNIAEIVDFSFNLLEDLNI